MQSAWLKDEIGKRRHHLPATGQPLQALDPQPAGGRAASMICPCGGSSSASSSSRGCDCST